MVRFILLAWMVSSINAVFAQEPPFKEGYIHTKDSAQLYYRIYGSQGDTILFLHGGPGGNLETPIEGYLPIAAKHVIISFDQRGGGRSTVADSLTLTLAKHVEDIESVRQYFRVSKMTIYGLSWGGTPALFYANKYPKYVSRLIIDGPMTPAKEPFDKERWDRYEIAVTELCRKRAEAAEAKDIDAFIVACKKSKGISWRVQYYDTANLSLDVGRAKRAASGIPGVNSLAQRRTMISLGNWDFRPIMAEVKTPTLLITGTHAYPPFEHVLIWSTTMPNAKILLIPNSGHETAQFENPNYFFKAIEEFLNGRWPRDAKD
jgi:proline-specific peptidase